MAGRLSAPVWLGAYLAGVLLVSFVHDPLILAGLLGGALLASGRQAAPLLLRSLRSVLAFNLSVSLGYAVLAGWRGEFHGDSLLLVNVRVLLLVYLGFLLVARVDLLAALRPFPLLQLIATVAISQIKTFERILRDFRLAFESRNLRPPRLLDKGRHAASSAHTLLDKTMVLSSQSALAMRSRGAFDD